ncbi:MAG: zinc ribbon domain-containing protein [Candidatus Thermoplasmatota archaeon]|nr:zinc ribbon domain-containing protein [Candidatus Thermoplasmatota archaeon]
MPVHCPSCEAPVEATSKFCLQCGHDLEKDGPITSTGHDVGQLKELIRSRDDLSMAEKFDMIAKVEDGANPIELGLAAPAEGSGVTPEQMEAANAAPKMTPGTISEAAQNYTTNPAAAAAVALMSQQTDAWGHIQSGSINTNDPLFLEAMALGMEASHHIHDIAAGGIDETDLTNDDLRAIPVLKPPKRSFCPKCGSDIHSHTMLQWRKWRDHSGEVVQLQAQAAMETSLVQVAAHYLTATQAAQAERDSLMNQLNALDEEALKVKITDELKPALMKEAEETLRKKVEEELRESIEEEIRADMAARGGGRKVVSTSGSSTFKPSKKKAAAPVVRRGAAKKTYEGEPDGKVEWFLSDALDTVFDPHGTGKVLKPKTILARSADGNVRVQDVVRIYADEGEDGLSELAWTSPFTKYIIEAFDAC